MIDQIKSKARTYEKYNIETFEWEESTVEIDVKDYKWLIKQVERVQDLEGDAENMYRANHDFSRRNDKLEQQNKRYRESLLEIKSVPYDVSGMSCGVMLSTVESLVNRALEE